jgi:hypothetical protein
MLLRLIEAGWFSVLGEIPGKCQYPHPLQRSVIRFGKAGTAEVAVITFILV